MTLREHLEWIEAHGDQEVSSRASAAVMALRAHVERLVLLAREDRNSGSPAVLRDRLLAVEEDALALFPDLDGPPESQPDTVPGYYTAGGQPIDSPWEQS